MLTAVVILLVLVAAAAAAAAVVRGRRLQEARDAVVTLARAWSEDGSSRGRVCAAAAHAAGARLALLAEPTPRGDAMTITATAEAPDVAGTTLPLDEAFSPSVRAFLRGEPMHVADVERSPEAATLLRRVGARSATLHPVRRADRVVGVLVVAWSRPRSELDAQRAELVAALADEAARAIERDAHVSLLSRQARTDELTALPNRRAWDEAVVREMSRAQRTGRPLCMALVDLDHFKAYNDAHGHQAGDAHLRRTAAAWRRELRAIDVLARYGGEEFGVLLPDCDIAEAREVIDRVRGATPNGESASAGVVRWDGRESADSLVARADAAMYRAKHAGRGVTVPA
ncbi:MAG TPA: sensor domain-containing diguanylate cyclase [Solirubrobacteraceae bacterium]|nr:sensor domain-containing diguanylate cyclase [Solirubrobacteraceae bacterium]